MAVAVALPVVVVVAESAQAPPSVQKRAATVTLHPRPRLQLMYWMLGKQVQVLTHPPQLLLLLPLLLPTRQRQRQRRHLLQLAMMASDLLTDAWPSTRAAELPSQRLQLARARACRQAAATAATAKARAVAARLRARQEAARQDELVAVAEAEAVGRRGLLVVGGQRVLPLHHLLLRMRPWTMLCANWKQR